MRVGQLLLGLVAFGYSEALMVLARLGLGPWDVLHQGLSKRTGLAIGTWVIIVGAAVLVLWWPLRLRPGLGTLCNVVLIGVALNVSLDLMPDPRSIAVRWTYLVVGIALNGVATGAYIGAALGPGPRDGLMVGLAERGHSIRVVRTLIEVSVLGIGFALGGTVGVGTVLFALTIGPIAHVTIPFFARTAPAARDERLRGELA